MANLQCAVIQLLAIWGGVKSNLLFHLTGIKHLSRRFVSNFIGAALLSFCVSCSGSEPDAPKEEPEPPVPVEQVVDYTSFQKFVARCSDAKDYCKRLNVTSAQITVTSVSGQSEKVSRGDVPYITVNANGSYSVNGKNLSGATARLSDLPAVTVDGGGNVVVNGVSTGVKAGKGLRAVVNTRKYVNFTFEKASYTIPNETYFPYNPPIEKSADKLSVLFIGNSFTMDATEHLPGMLEAAGVSNVVMTRLYHGGYTLPEYFANFSASNVCARYDYKAGDATWVGNSTLDDTPMDALKARNWDVIVIQEHTGRSEAWSWPGVLGPAVESLRDLFHAAQPSHRPTIVYLLAQTYSNNSPVLVTSFGNDRKKMFDTTTGVAKELIAGTGIDVVVSSAATIENLRTTSLNINNGLQLSRDGYHLDYGISRYAVSCAVYETIFTPSLGINISGCNYRYAKSSTTPDGYSTPVTDQNAPIAQKAAHEAVLKPFEVTEIGL